jgi:hypothetical protein
MCHGEMAPADGGHSGQPVERHQLLNPFKFVYYAGLTDLELASAG